MPILAHIGLGSNLGDRRANLDAASALLAEAPGVRVLRVSRSYATDSVGGPPGQGAFLNAAATLETSLDAPALLRLLHEVEARLGRTRAVRWGERTLDLDLLLHGSSKVETPNLIVPHPRMALRRFVLAPLGEIAADAVDPFTGHTVAGLLANLDRRPGLIALSQGLPFPRAPIFARLVRKLGAVGLANEPLDQAIDARLGTDAALSDPIRRLRLARQAGELHAARWSAEVWGDRWIVADTCLDHALRDSWRALKGLDPSEPADDLARAFFAAALAPTFVVTAGLDAWNCPAHDLTRRAGLPGRPREAPPALRVFPRPDLPEPPPQPRGGDEGRETLRAYHAAWRDAIVAEVLAACEAGRTRVEPA